MKSLLLLLGLCLSARANQVDDSDHVLQPSKDAVKHLVSSADAKDAPLTKNINKGSLERIHDELIKIQDEVEDVEEKLSEETHRKDNTVVDDSESEIEQAKVLFDLNHARDVEHISSLTKRTVTPRRSNALSKRSEIELPESFHWPKEMFGPARDQSSCGSCWAFPFVAQLEFLYQVYTGESIRFSEQFTIACIDPIKGTSSDSKQACGCHGGTVNAGAKYMMKEQYMPEEYGYPGGKYVANCRDGCLSEGKANAFTKLWVNDFVPLGQGEKDVLKELLRMPIALLVYIGSVNYWWRAPSSGSFEDSDCGKAANNHAILLTGYDEETITIRNSHSTRWGNEGYADLIRNSNLNTCNYWKHGFAMSVSYRREIQYARPKGPKTTFDEARKRCQAMDTDEESGWDLAIIPTRMHQSQIREHFGSPSDKLEVHIGLMAKPVNDGDETGEKHLQWVDPLEPVNYIPTWKQVNGNDYDFILDTNKELVTFFPNVETVKWHNNREAWVACSRFKTCWNFDTFVGGLGGSVRYTDNSLVQGTVATITCESHHELDGPNTLTCKGGRWLDDEGNLYHPLSFKLLDHKTKRKDIPACVLKKKDKKKKKKNKDKKKNKKKKKGGNEAEQSLPPRL